MTWFADLSECTYFGQRCANNLRAVGWLECGKPFAEGPVDDIFWKRLSDLLRDPWQPVVFAGFHVCDFCFEDQAFRSRYRSIPRYATSHRNLFIPGKKTNYVCPEGVCHYIAKHDYAPPAEFARAVVHCPPMGSDAYFAALRANGGNTLVDGTCFESAINLLDLSKRSTSTVASKAN